MIRDEEQPMSAEATCRATAGIMKQIIARQKIGRAIIPC